MAKTITALALSGLLALSGCGPEASKSDSGLLAGAVAGGIIGNAAGRGGGRAGATIVGAVVGGIIGGEIGRKMDRRDQYLAQQAEFEALDRGYAGRPVIWRNSDNGRYGEIIPGEYYRQGPSECRDYTHKIYIDGRPEVLRGTACRNPDGTWRSVG